MYKPFTTYQVYYVTGGSPSLGVAYEAEIDCFSPDKSRAGSIFFYSDEIPIPENTSNINGIQLYYNLNRFNDVMTMLKEEKPLYLSLHDVKKYGYVGTYNEPVGEKEV